LLKYIGLIIIVRNDRNRKAENTHSSQQDPSQPQFSTVPVTGKDMGAIFFFLKDTTNVDRLDSKDVWFRGARYVSDDVPIKMRKVA
jgi:hypothetical protein